MKVAMINDNDNDNDNEKEKEKEKENRASRPRPASNCVVALTCVAVEEALGRADSRASEEERLLQRLLAREVPILDLLHEAKAKLVCQLLEKIEQPRVAFSVARVLREVVAVSATLSKRSQALAGALISLRAQRRMLELAMGGRDGN